MPKPTPEIEAAARAIAQAMGLPWPPVKNGHLCRDAARAAIEAVLLEPSERLVAAVSIANGDAGGMTARFILRAAGRHILGDEP